MKNQNCDGGFCKKEEGEVRVLPSGDGNLFLCRACFDNEMKFRRDQNRTVRMVIHPIVKWKDLKLVELVESVS